MPSSLIREKFISKNQNIKSRYNLITELIKKKQDTRKKSPSSLSDSTDQKSNVTKQNPKLNIERESILSSKKQASTLVHKAINQCQKHL